MRFKHGEGVRWSLELRRIAGAVGIEGTVNGTIDMECYRCLEVFPWPLSIRIREHALWLGEAGEEADEETASEYVVTDGVLDLEPILRDTIALAFPAKRVCDEACKGLCVQCGTNLNLEPCTCEPPPPDRRLSPLADLKKRLEQ
jgi:uncharacterized protein